MVNISDIPSEPTTDGRIETAKQIRRLMRAVIVQNVGASVWEKVGGELKEIADKVDKETVPGQSMRVIQRNNDDGSSENMFLTSPVSGPVNPISAPVKWTANPDGNGVLGIAVFDDQHEGPPTCVHGGILALVFDELLGAANIRAGFAGMTGTLSIRYSSPTPLHKEVKLYGECLGKDGRKIRSIARAEVEGVITATAEGVFISVNPDQFLKIAEKNAGESAEEMLKQRYSTLSQSGEIDKLGPSDFG